MSRAKDGERPLIDQAVAGNSPVYGPGWKFPPFVAEGVAGKPGLFLPGRTVYFCPFQPGGGWSTLSLTTTILPVHSVCSTNGEYGTALETLEFPCFGRT